MKPALEMNCPSPINIGIPFVTMALLVVLSAHVRAEPSAAGFPGRSLRNGNFSASQGWSRPTSWDPATDSGEHDFVMDPPATFVSRPSAAVIRTRQSASVYSYQKLPLLEGDHALSAEVTRTGKTSVRVVSGSSGTDLVAVGARRPPLHVAAPSLRGETAVGLRSSAEAGGSATFGNVKLEIERLANSPIALEDGSRLGALVLPSAPTLAESCACYELQRYVHRMTERTPGLEGRDAVHAGKRLYPGRAAGPGLRERLEDLRDDSYLIYSAGELGEVVPRRETLAGCTSRIESPDYDARSVMVLAQDFFPTSGWITIHADDYFDWFLRNRMKLIWCVGTETFDLGEHRGHGWIQRLDHFYNNLVAPHGTHFKENSAAGIWQAVRIVKAQA